MMRNPIFIFLVAFAAAFGSGAACAQTAGDWVLGNFQGAGRWYPGIVQSTSGGQVIVLYDDGDTEILPASRVRHYNWMVGTRVECNYQNQGTWYPGKIASLSGERVGINYDDGDKEITRTGLCRSR
ncbi:MAG: tudor domain-containing protein [Corticimicrobacter sp.]|uniref:tudor domain-containing protein n=1 Tax=Corticimicrobacter sp. TaxID=2678536 RepID=UPI0032DB3C79